MKAWHQRPARYWKTTPQTNCPSHCQALKLDCIWLLWFCDPPWETGRWNCGITLDKCWSNVCDVGPAFIQRCTSVSCRPGSLVRESAGETRWWKAHNITQDPSLHMSHNLCLLQLPNRKTLPRCWSNAVPISYVSSVYSPVYSQGVYGAHRRSHLWKTILILMANIYVFTVMSLDDVVKKAKGWPMHHNKMISNILVWYYSWLSHGRIQTVSDIVVIHLIHGSHENNPGSMLISRNL